MRYKIQLYCALILLLAFTIAMIACGFSLEISGLFVFLILCDTAWIVFATIKLKEHEFKSAEAEFDLFLTTNNLSADKRYSFGSKKYVFSFESNVLTIANISPADAELDIKSIKLNSLKEVELLQDSAVIQKGGFGGSVVGGLVGGVTGAIIGSNLRNNENQCSMLAIRLLFKDKMNPIEIVHIISSPVNKSSQEYSDAFNVAQEIYATLVAILEETQQHNSV